MIHAELLAAAKVLTQQYPGIRANARGTLVSPKQVLAGLVREAGGVDQAMDAVKQLVTPAGAMYRMLAALEDMKR